MKHLEKCEKCGKDFDPSVAKGPREEPEYCDACGADINPRHKHSEFLVEDEDNDHTSLEKTLRGASHKADRE
ncbi:hypothetical protein [Vreelandella sp. EE22]